MDKLVKQFNETGDLLFQAYEKNNPACRLNDNEYKLYKSLGMGDKVFVKEPKSNQAYVPGKIVNTRQAGPSGWIYEVRTQFGAKWRALHDFQLHNKLCLFDIAPDKKVIDLCQE